MPRATRVCRAGTVWHCLNRAVARLTSFEKDTDYEAFERVLEEVHERVAVRILDLHGHARSLAFRGLAGPR